MFPRVIITIVFSAMFVFVFAIGVTSSQVTPENGGLGLLSSQVADQDIPESANITAPANAEDNMSIASADDRFIPNFNYPRVTTYGAMGSASGEPLDTDEALQAAARSMALHVIAEPLMSRHQDSYARLRELNPGQATIAYITTGWMWENNYPVGYLWGDILKKVKLPYPDQPSVDWLVWAQSGVPYYQFVSNYSYNFTKTDFVDWYVDIVATRIYGSGLFDGLYMDGVCDAISFTQGVQYIDYAHDGYGTLAAWDTAYAAGINRFIANLRQRVGNDWVMLGNCGRLAHDQDLNGVSFEGFPIFQNNSPFTHWIDNMLYSGGGGGYLLQERQKRAPHYNMLLGEVPSDNYLDYLLPAHLKKMRWGLTSTLLGDGYYFMLHEPLTADVTNNSHLFWYDEYDNAGQGTGYLGQPTSAAYQMIDRAGLSGSELWANGEIENGTTGWALYASGSYPGNSWSVDTTTFKSGAASLKASVTNPQTDSWIVTAAQSPTVTNGNTYSLTWWAKSDRDRTANMVITVDPYTPGDRSDDKFGLNQMVILGPEWQEYQVSFNATASGTASVNFFLGHEAGLVWLDDVSLKRGVSNIWRRDFDHGSAFVNPCRTGYDGCVTQTFPLAANMRHINGTQDATVNNGQVVSSVSVPTEDGVILLSTTSPPASPAQCTENWVCGDWSLCTINQQTRTCADTNACRTTVNRPALTQACTDSLGPNSVSDLRTQ